jgi:hypothetical protein
VPTCDWSGMKIVVNHKSFNDLMTVLSCNVVVGRGHYIICNRDP